MNKIQGFVKNNNLELTGSGSELNSNCAIISGYALHLNYTDINSLIDDITQDDKYNLDSKTEKELKKTFLYAKNRKYGDWWTTDEAKNSNFIF